MVKWILRLLVWMILLGGMVFSLFGGTLLSRPVPEPAKISIQDGRPAPEIP